MPDPADRDLSAELESFNAPGLTMDPLPAAEVRRRGTRMRRRNNALAVAGAVAAVVVIATPIAFAAGGRGPDTTPPPATQSPSPSGSATPSVSESATPSVSWRTEFPRDFPIAEGMPRGTTVDKMPAPTGMQVCGTDPVSVLVPPLTKRSLASASYAEPGSEGADVRTISLFRDDQAALAAEAALQELMADCPTDPNGSGLSLVNEVESADLGGEASLVVRQQSRDADGLLADLTTVEVVRTGNAVLVASSHTAAGGPSVVDTAADQLAERSAPVIDAMCVFSADPC